MSGVIPVRHNDIDDEREKGSNDSRNSRFNAAQCFLIAGGVRCRKFGICDKKCTDMSLEVNGTFTGH